MAQLTRQYLEYVEMMRTKQLELAAEYLLMAAMLIEIKSRLLLPRPPAAEPIEDDPRAELVRRLLEYERMKKAAQAIDELPQVGRDVIAISVLDRADRRRAPARRRHARTWPRPGAGCCTARACRRTTTSRASSCRCART